MASNFKLFFNKIIELGKFVVYKWTGTKRDIVIWTVNFSKTLRCRYYLVIFLLNWVSQKANFWSCSISSVKLIRSSNILILSRKKYNWSMPCLQIMKTSSTQLNQKSGVGPKISKTKLSNGRNLNSPSKSAIEDSRSVPHCFVCSLDYLI